MMHFVTTSKARLKRRRLGPVYDAALSLWQERDAVEWFLDQSHPLLDGRTPREVALESPEGANRVVQLLGRAEAGVAV